MQPVFIIAEAGVNHNGDLKLALELVDEAAAAGADAVKFQTFKASRLASRHAKQARYQVANTGSDESQLEMLKRLELSRENHLALIERCRQKQIQFLSTPFDDESADFLIRDLQLPQIKIGSGEIVNAPLLLQVAQAKLPIILSSGMSTLIEVEQALGVLAFGYLGGERDPGIDAFESAFASDQGQALLAKNVSLLHCTSEYPTPFSEVNLRAMDTLRSAFGLPVGLSDHTEGISVAIAAAARGAQIIEKHFTMSKSLPGPDHKASLDPAELKALVCGVREVEKALGSGVKRPAPVEVETKRLVRRSLVATQAVRKGEVFTAENLGSKRPGTGYSPMHYWSWLGRRADRDYAADEVIGSEA